MDIRHLRTLVTAAEADSFANAAEQLFITPAAVSQQIRFLEQELGIQLFDRSIRPPQLNGNAEHIVARARELIEQFNDFKSSANKSGVSGHLAIGSITGITVSLLPETLRSLTRRHPKVRIRIEEGTSHVLIRRIKRRELDAAIITDVPDLPSTIERLPIFSEPLVVIENSGKELSSWRDALRQNSYLRMNRNSGLGELIDNYIKRQRVKLTDSMELDSSDSIVQMALSGLGAGIVPIGRVSAEATRTLHIYPFGDPQIQRNVVMVQRRNTRISELTNLLYQEIQSQIAERTP